MMIGMGTPRNQRRMLRMLLLHIWSENGTPVRGRSPLWGFGEYNAPVCWRFLQTVKSMLPMNIAPKRYGLSGTVPAVPRCFIRKRIRWSYVSCFTGLSSFLLSP